MKEYTAIDIKILNSLLRDYKLKAIERTPDKSNGILLHLSNDSGNLVALSVEFDVKENPEDSIKTKISIN